MIGKKANVGDYTVAVLFAIVLAILSFAAMFVVVPDAVERSEYEIKEQAEDVSENLFIYGFLRQKIEDKNMADLIVLSYMSKEYDDLGEETIKILEKTGREVNFKIYIGDEEIKECRTKCKGEYKDFVVSLPVPNNEVIDFRLVLYEAK